MSIIRSSPLLQTYYAYAPSQYTYLSRGSIETDFEEGGQAHCSCNWWRHKNNSSNAYCAIWIHSIWPSFQCDECIGKLKNINISQNILSQRRYICIIVSLHFIQNSFYTKQPFSNKVFKQQLRNTNMLIARSLLKINFLLFQGDVF